MKKSKFVYLVELNDGKKWVFESKAEAVELMEKKLHLKKDGIRDVWGVRGYQTKAKLIELIMSGRDILN